MVELLRIVLGFNTSLDSRRGSQIKFHPNFPRLGRRGTVGREFKKGRVEIRLMRSHLARNVEKHFGACLLGSHKCFGCGKIGHEVRDCSNAKGQEKGGKPSGSSDAPKKNRFYDLRTRDDQEASHDVVTDMLQIIAIDVYALLDPGATLSFVTSFVDKSLILYPMFCMNLLWYLLQWVSQLY